MIFTLLCLTTICVNISDDNNVETNYISSKLSQCCINLTDNTNYWLSTADLWYQWSLETSRILFEIYIALWGIDYKGYGKRIILDLNPSSAGEGWMVKL